MLKYIKKNMEFRILESKKNEVIMKIGLNKKNNAKISKHAKKMLWIYQIKYLFLIKIKELLLNKY